MAGYLTLDGVGDSISTPDSSQLDITGDIDVRMCVAADQWHNGGIGANNRQVVIGKWVESGNQRSWKFSFQPGGTLENPVLFPFFQWSANGSTSFSIQPQTTIPRPPDGQPVWFRVAFEPVVNVSQRRWALYWSDDPPETDPDVVDWALLQLFTGSTNTALFNSSSPVRIGHTTGIEAQFAGKFYYAEIRDGIGGTKVANPDPRTNDQGWSSPPVTDDFGNVWSFHGDTFWTGPSTIWDLIKVQSEGLDLSETDLRIFGDTLVKILSESVELPESDLNVKKPALSGHTGWGIPIGI